MLLLPDYFRLLFATGPGKIGNRTIGTAAAGGMLIGTVCGVLCNSWIVLHFWQELLKDINYVKNEEENPLTEEIDNNDVQKL